MCERNGRERNGWLTVRKAAGGSGRKRRVANGRAALMTTGPHTQRPRHRLWYLHLCTQSALQLSGQSVVATSEGAIVEQQQEVRGAACWRCDLGP
jgi:hypothetical protein